ncbi:V-type ATPase subunit [Candidatus Kaiserbacteria bacterium]|nr:V-type ATPase subunit [Candidatus Kaiserbacteria bacterium]USN91931.1 MAG: V-type ATPase subunit [Candidatus Nomurabacteria bacterium]
MKTSYIYSVSRVNALSQFLLTKTDIDRLLVADKGEDMQSALKETYLAPYIVRVPNEDVSLAIEQTLIDAKHLVHRLSPNSDSDMFRIMWIQYDIHNLRVFAKATASKLAYEECGAFLSHRGVYDPEYLYSCVEKGSLDSLQPGWQKAYEKALQTVAVGDIHVVDGIFDELYFTTSKAILNVVGDQFMKSYLSTYIDLYNLKSRLRHLKNEGVDFKPVFVDGGSFTADKIETAEDVYTIFSRFGGSDFWKEAIEYYQATGNTTSIDARSGEFMLVFAKEGSYDMFSPASLVLYYLKCRQAAANIRIIVVGINSGMKESAIRANLRMAYVND